MLDRRPAQGERRSWIYPGIWSLLIFVTVPAARTIQAYVSEHWGRDFFLYGVVIIIVLLFIISLQMLTTRRTATVMNHVWLVSIATIFIAYTIQLRGNPEEAVHFVQYGVLGILVFRALTHRIYDYGIYLVALLLGARGHCIAR